MPVDSAYEIIAKQNKLKDEMTSIETRICELNVLLTGRLPTSYYHQCRKEKAQLASKKILLQQELSAIKADRHFLLNEAFMQTCIKMMDPQDITEIWDRVYVDYPYLNDRRF